MNMVCYGGGTNSTAMLVGLSGVVDEKKRRKVDVIIFSDTGGELPETYEYVEYFSRWLVEHGMPAITVVRTVNREGDVITLEADCLRRATLPAIVFGWKTCSERFKTRPQNKFMNNWPPAKAHWATGDRITKLVGFDAGEERRAKPFEDKKYVVDYPLISWEWDRDDCVEAIKQAGLRLPGKSSCFFCPSSRAVEILKLDEEDSE